MALSITYLGRVFHSSAVARNQGKIFALLFSAFLCASVMNVDQDEDNPDEIRFDPLRDNSD